MSWDRVKRLNASELLARISEAAGVRLVYEGPCTGGQVGAAYVRWPDGRPAVLTWRPGTAKAEVERSAELLTLARKRGLPVPEYQLVVELPDAVVLVQERLPGTVPDDLNAMLLSAMIDCNRRFAGILADRPDVPPIELFLTYDGPGFCLHGPLAEYGRRSARLLSWIHEVGRQVPARMTGHDLVHMDFHQQNVLVGDESTITGIVDWDGTGRGDHRFDLVTLRFAVPPDRPDLAARLDAELDARLTPDELRPYWASMALRMVDWAIRHPTDDVVKQHLALADTRMT
jgi:Ser/Thr protein kinase RdoA (MazF antagonist)